MGKSKKLGKLIATSVVAYVFFAITVGLFVFLGMQPGVLSFAGAADGLNGYVQYHLNQLKAFITFSSTVPQPYNMVCSGLVVGFLGLSAIGFITTLIVTIAKKRGAVILGMFSMIFVAGLAFIAAGEGIYGTVAQNIGENVMLSIIAAAVILAGIIFFILALASWIKALKLPRKDEEAAVVVEEPEVIPEFEPEPTPAQPTYVQPAFDAYELAKMIREIVRDELDNNQCGPVDQTITGATFSGPLVVQYFNGMAPAAAPAQEKPKEEPKQEEPAPVEEPVEEPVAEEPVEEPAPVEEPVEEPAPVEETVAEEPAPVEEQPAEEEKAKIVRIPFVTRMLEAEDDMKANYNELKNEILSWGVKSRVSNSGDTFRLHRKTYIKLTIAGKSLKLYFALDPKDYEGSTIPVQDAGNKGIYEEIPLVFKVKSGLSLRRCKQLIQDVMEKDGLEQSEVLQINWVKELEAAQDAADDDED